MASRRTGTTRPGGAGAQASAASRLSQPNPRRQAARPNTTACPGERAGAGGEAGGAEAGPSRATGAVRRRPATAGGGGGGGGGGVLRRETVTRRTVETTRSTVTAIPGAGGPGGGGPSGASRLSQPNPRRVTERYQSQRPKPQPRGAARGGAAAAAGRGAPGARGAPVGRGAPPAGRPAPAWMGRVRGRGRGRGTCPGAAAAAAAAPPRTPPDEQRFRAMATGLEGADTDWQQEAAEPWRDDFELERQVGDVERAAPWEGGGGWMLHYLKQLDEEEREETVDEPRDDAPTANMAPPWWDLAAERPPELEESLVELPSPERAPSPEPEPEPVPSWRQPRPVRSPSPLRRRQPKRAPRAQMRIQRADPAAGIMESGEVCVPPPPPPMPPSRPGYTPGEELPSTTPHDMADFFSRMRVYATDVATGKCRNIDDDPMDLDPLYRENYRRLQTYIQSEQQQLFHEEGGHLDKDKIQIIWNRQMAKKARERRPPDARPLPNALVPLQLRAARRFIADVNARDCRLRDYMVQLGKLDDVPERPPRYDPNFLAHTVEPLQASLAPQHVRTALIKAHEFLEPVAELVALPCMRDDQLLDLSFPEPVPSYPTSVQHGAYAQELFDLLG